MASSFRKKHAVFLSFRGVDTRYGFTSFLYEALRKNRIQTYMDVHLLENGDEISSKLLGAIEQATISVIIFSKNYASSTWCLDELVKILDCKKRYEQIVIPVFYHIKPSIVRKQKHSYAVAFAKHEKRFVDKMGKVKRWRNALKDAANLKGFDSKLVRPGPKLVRKIVNDILLKLRNYQSSNFFLKGLIEIDERMREIEYSLRIDSADVRIIGIWGMGGIGKTTLASAIFHKLYPRFQSQCFLSDVRGQSASAGVGYLRNKLLNDLFNDGAIVSLDTPFAEPSIMRDRIHRKKVLVVLDGVDSSDDLETLIEGYEDLAPGSRIIVTTRNKQVVRKVANELYEVQGLNYSEALELFHSRAFTKMAVPTDYQVLSKSVVDYARGNPLALKVLGSFLHFKRKEEWESALENLKRDPNENILMVLRISYDGLDDMDKAIFLDIACFFKGFQRDEVESILDKDSSRKIGLNTLIEKSLLTIDPDDQRVCMHGLVQRMGFMIVRDENEEPGNRSRLWNATDICHVLETASGTETIKSINLDLSHLEKHVEVSPAAFSKMCNLQYLHIFSLEEEECRLHLTRGFEFCPSVMLRYLRWDFYPLKSLPSDFIPENLVYLILRNSQLVALWDEVQPAFKKLKVIDLHGSKFLTQVPNLSLASSIEKIDLGGCISLNLVQVPKCMMNLPELERLDMSGCLPLKMLPEIVKPMERLVYISLRGTMIEELPDSIVNLVGLLNLDLSLCKNIESLPNSLSSLRRVERLDLQGCSKLQKLPPLPPGLFELDVRFCENLKSIPELPPVLTYLNASYCTSLETVSSWRTPLIHEQSCFLGGGSYRFDNCKMLHENTRNNILPRGVSLEILSAARSSRNLYTEHDEPSAEFCYPGDGIPKYFNYQTDVGTLINIELPPYWCNVDFLGFAFCLVLDLSNIVPAKFRADIECVCNFKTIHERNNVDYPYKVPLKWYFQCVNPNSDHVFVLYDHELSFNMLQENFGADWSSICSSNVTEATFDFQLSLHFDDGSSSVVSDEGHKIKRKCGVWLVYEQDGQSMDDEELEEETRRFAQLSQVSEASTNHKVVSCGEDESYDVNINPKRIKLQ